MCFILLSRPFVCTRDGKQQISNRSSGQKSKRSKWQIVYEEKAGSIRKKISIAKAETDRLKENRKVTKRGTRNREILQRECKVLSIASLVNYMERQKCALRKLKRAFGRKKFKDDAGRVYANMREMLAKNEDCDRSKYEGVSGNTCEDEREGEVR